MHQHIKPVQDKYTSQSNQKDLLFQMGTYKIATWKSFVSNLKKYNKICICPNCFATVHLSRNSCKFGWSSPKEERIGVFHELSKKYVTEDRFLDHCNSCEPILNPGINCIDVNSSERLWQLVEMFSYFAKMDEGRSRYDDARRIYPNDYMNGNLVAYVYNSNIGPISFAIFKEINYEEFGGKLPLLWDTYTFPNYRNHGYASEIIEFAIEDLGLDRSMFPIYRSENEELLMALNKVGVQKVAVI